MTTAYTPTLHRELSWCFAQSKAPKIRTMRQFAEQEVVVHTGPFKGRFRVRNQPLAGLWLDAVDSGRWQRFNTTGPRQGGKTLLGDIVPTLFHLFEIGETVIFAVPDMDIADDKFRENLLPAIAATRFAELLPSSGEGSRNGRVKNAVVFKNGATLKFMSGGASGLASDRGRQGYTARIVVVTEKSAFGGGGEASVEANKLEQIRACTNAFGDQARFYEESTLTTELDPTYVDLKQGTDSRIACPCPHCLQFVTPEREHLRGWQEAQTVTEAKEKSHFVCPACGQPISEDQRRSMNETAVLLHRGQTIAMAEETGESGQGTVQPLILGEPPATDTLGFRFSAFNNLFRTAGDVGMDEWRGARATDEEDAERKLCQFVWCLPYQSQVQALSSLSPQGLTTRQSKTAKGLVPAETVLLTVGCDLGKWVSWWKAIAWFPIAGTGIWSGVVVEYGKLDVQSNLVGEEPALLKALAELRDDICEKGWTWEGHGGTRPADLVSIDSAYKGNVVFQFVRECNAKPETRDRYWPVRGFGEGQLAGHSYHQPKKTGNQVLLVGDAYHVTAFPAERVHVLEFDADHWKTFYHERYACEATQPGAMLLHQALPKQHLELAKHLTAEKQTIEFVPDKGEVIRWVVVRRANHWLDCGVGASVVGHFGGARVLPADRIQKPDSGSHQVAPAVVTPDGRPFLITER
jgi:phage terminase large subunit GpA-like protein